MDLVELGWIKRLMIVAALVGCEAPAGTNGNSGETSGGGGPDAGSSTTESVEEDDGDDDAPTDDDNSGSDTDDPNPLGGECPRAERVGGFEVLLEEAYSAIDGEVRSAALQTVIQTVHAEEGDCYLLRNENPFCDPPCSGGEACSASATCAAFPERVEVGTVTIAGLEVEVALEPAADKRYFHTDLPHPAIAPGSVIELSADGGEYSGFSLDGVGFGPLTGVSSPLLLAPETPLAITWEPEGGEARIAIAINIDQHGTSPSNLLCDVEDTGSYEVPAVVIDALLESGVSGYPSANLYRQTADSTQMDTGCVDFRVRARAEAQIEVEGHTACMNDTQCPPGETCNIPIQTCE